MNNINPVEVETFKETWQVVACDFCIEMIKIFHKHIYSIASTMMHDWITGHRFKFILSAFVVGNQPLCKLFCLFVGRESVLFYNVIDFKILLACVVIAFTCGNC